MVILLCALPALWLAWTLHTTNSYHIFAVACAGTGQVSLIFLGLTLSCTPLRLLTGWTGFARMRRTLGLAAFAYAAAHLGVYTFVGQHGRLGYILDDTLQRLSRPPGWLAFLLLIPLAATSTRAMLQRLGGRRWKRLHTLVYPATACAIAHLAWVDQENNTDFHRTRIAACAFVICILVRWPLQRLAKWRQAT